MIQDEQLKVHVNPHTTLIDSQEYRDIDEWVIGCEGATWDYNGEYTMYHGVNIRYYTTILFDNEEDLLFCRLRFPMSTSIPK